MLRLPAPVLPWQRRRRRRPTLAQASATGAARGLVVKDGLTAFVGLLLSVWLCGIPFFVWAVHATRTWIGPPRGWPWTLPIWPLMLLQESWQQWRDRQRLRRMKAEVWRR